MIMSQIRNIAKKHAINSFGKINVELIREMQRKQCHFD